MILKDIINQTNWETVKEGLLRLYPKQENNIIGYETIFSKLKTLEPVACDMRLMLSEVKAEDADSEDWTDVCGIEMKPKQDKENMSYGMEFMEWNQWLDLELTKEILNNYKTEDIIAHCLFEMTFWGFDEATIQEEAQSLNEEALNDSESIPLEDFLKSLRDESPDEESQED